MLCKCHRIYAHRRIVRVVLSVKMFWINTPRKPTSSVRLTGGRYIPRSRILTQWSLGYCALREGSSRYFQFCTLLNYSFYYSLMGRYRCIILPQMFSVKNRHLYRESFAVGLYRGRTKLVAQYKVNNIILSIRHNIRFFKIIL